ncbi:SIR2 family protein [Lactobacillus helveticus]|uniref:SIR2 family protein n=1 Tax=Lactobacillus helveticus TaxID=1587 RepID=UPI003750E7DA
MKIKELRKLTISKRLNILIGSGCSLPAIPLMNNYQDKISDIEEANDALESKIKQVSKVLTDSNFEKIKRNKSIYTTLHVYILFVQKIIDILNLSNARDTPRRANIFTTNYDLFLEKAFDQVSQDSRFIINDGAKGYFNRVLESSNFDQIVSYKGLNDNFISEIPSISLIKPHGSVNWKRDIKNDLVYIRDEVVSNPLIVKPTHLESHATFNQNHFFSMLRFFTNELDKSQSVLLVVGFSFQDIHIAKMVRRAVANPELMILCFCYTNDDVKTILSNLDFDLKESIPKNINFFVPEENSDDKGKKENNENNEYKDLKLELHNKHVLKSCNEITLKEVVEFLNGIFDEEDNE